MNSRKRKKKAISFVLVCLAVICLGIPSLAATSGSASGTYGQINVSRYDGDGGTDAYQKTSTAKWVESYVTIYDKGGNVIGSKKMSGSANYGVVRSAYAYSPGPIVYKSYGRGLFFAGTSPSTPLLESLAKTVSR